MRTSLALATRQSIPFIAAFLGLLAAADVASAQAIRQIAVVLGTGNDDLRAGSTATLALVGADATGRPFDQFTMSLTGDRERLTDRSIKPVPPASLPMPLSLASVDHVELRFVADEGVGNDQWHCSSIRVVANPGTADQMVLWSQTFSRDDRLNQGSPTRRSLRLAAATSAPIEVEVELTTGEDDLRHTQWGWVTIETVDGREFGAGFHGPFPSNTTRTIRFDLPADVPALLAHRIWVSVGWDPNVTHLALPLPVWDNPDKWDLSRIRVTSSRDGVIFAAPPGRISQLVGHAVFASPVLRPKAIGVLSTDRFLVRISTGADDLRVGVSPRSDAELALILRDGRRVPLQVFDPSATPGQFAGSFERWRGAWAVARPVDGRTIVLADIGRVVVHMVTGIGSGPMADDQWSLAGVRLFVPAPGRADASITGPRWWEGWRTFHWIWPISGVKLNKHQPDFMSAALP